MRRFCGGMTVMTVVTWVGMAMTQLGFVLTWQEFSWDDSQGMI